MESASTKVRIFLAGPGFKLFLFNVSIFYFTFESLPCMQVPPENKIKNLSFRSVICNFHFQITFHFQIIFNSRWQHILKGHCP